MLFGRFPKIMTLLIFSGWVLVCDGAADIVFYIIMKLGLRKIAKKAETEKEDSVADSSDAVNETADMDVPNDTKTQDENAPSERQSGKETEYPTETTAETTASMPAQDADGYSADRKETEESTEPEEEQKQKDEEKKKQEEEHRQQRPGRQQDGPQQGRHGYGFHMRLSFRLLGSGYHSLSRLSSIIYRNSNNNFCLYEFCNFLLHFGGGGYILSTGNNRIAVFGAGRNSPPAVIVCERPRPQEPAQFRYRQYSLDERRRVRHCHNALF